jgi:hypothetical protein
MRQYTEKTSNRLIQESKIAGVVLERRLMAETLGFSIDHDRVVIDSARQFLPRVNPVAPSLSKKRLMSTIE